MPVADDAERLTVVLRSWVRSNNNDDDDDKSASFSAPKAPTSKMLFFNKPWEGLSFSLLFVVRICIL